MILYIGVFSPNNDKGPSCSGMIGRFQALQEAIFVLVPENDRSYPSAAALYHS